MMSWSWRCLRTKPTRSQDVLADLMIDACLRWFPHMPTRDLCKAKIGRVWS